MNSQPLIAETVQIPQRLEKLLDMLRFTLEEQGSLHCRREPDRKTPTWRIRYRYTYGDGETRQFNVNLGRDERVAAAAWELVQIWRAERLARDHVRRQEEKMKAAKDGARKRLGSALQKLLGEDGAGQVQAALVAVDAGNPIPTLALALSAGLSPGKAPRQNGRPPRGRLW